MHRKFLITLIITLVAIFGLSAFTTTYLKRSTEDLTSILTPVEKNIEAGSWQKSHDSLADLKNKWDSSKDNWYILIDHMEIDRIEDSMTRLEIAIKINNKEQAVPEAAILREQISHIYEKERFNLRNIL